MEFRLNLELDLSRFRGEVAAEACARKAVASGWDREGAGRFIWTWLLTNGPTPGEELTDQAKKHGFRPHEDRAFGAVYQGLVRKGKIRCVGFCLRQKGNGTAGGRVWSAT